METRNTTTVYRSLLLVTVIATITALIVFATLMANAEFGTEQRKAYQTWFTYSSYFGITIATILGILWYFSAPKKKKRNLPLKQSDAKFAEENISNIRK